jgi:hypothetical protein
MSFVHSNPAYASGGSLPSTTISDTQEAPEEGKAIQTVGGTPVEGQANQGWVSTDHQ